MALTQWTDPNPPADKWCWCCNRKLPRDDKHFRPAKNTPDGLTWMCLSCLRDKGATEPGLIFGGGVLK